MNMIGKDSGYRKREPKMRIGPAPGGGGGGGLIVQEIDGLPFVRNPKAIKFTNGTVTDNGDGTVTVTVSGGGGGSITIQEQDGSPSIVGASVLQLHQADGLRVTEPVGGTALLRVQPQNRAVNANFNLLVTDNILLVDTSGGDLDGTLDTPSGNKRYTLKITGGSNIITLTPASGLIDGEATYIWSGDQTAIDVYYDGSAWWVL